MLVSKEGLLESKDFKLPRPWGSLARFHLEELMYSSSSDKRQLNAGAGGKLEAGVGLRAFTTPARAAAAGATKQD